MQENWSLCKWMWRRWWDHEANKKGWSFLVLNKYQYSLDDEANVTISHELLVAVQEDEKEQESNSDNDIAKE